MTRRTFLGAALALTATPVIGQTRQFTSDDVAEAAASLEYARHIAQNPYVQRIVPTGISILNDPSFTRYGLTLYALRHGAQIDDVGGQAVVGYCVAIQTATFGALLAPHLENNQLNGIFLDIAEQASFRAEYIDRRFFGGNARPGNCTEIYQRYLP
jgi:hypothetical protein